MKLAAALVLAVAACGGSSRPPPQAPSSSPGPLAIEPAAPAPAPAPAADGPVTFSFEDSRITPSRPIQYEVGGDELIAADEPILQALADLLAEKSALSLVRIEVHTDAAGDGGANQALSERRALATARALVAHGVDCQRLLPVGFGETKPISDNQTAAGRAANRRTEFAPVALRGVVIGGLPPDGGGQVAGDPCAK